MRELVWMAGARQKAMWTLGSSVMALLANLHRKPRTRPLKPSDFNPFEDRIVKKAPLTVLRDVFVKEKG